MDNFLASLWETLDHTAKNTPSLRHSKGSGAICGCREVAEALIISHKLVIQKTKEETTSVEAAFGNEFRPPRKALKFRDFHKSQCTALSIVNSEKWTPNQIFSFWNKQKAHTPQKRKVSVHALQHNPGAKSQYICCGAESCYIKDPRIFWALDRQDKEQSSWRYSLENTGSSRVVGAGGTTLHDPQIQISPLASLWWLEIAAKVSRGVRIQASTWKRTLLHWMVKISTRY